MTPVTSSFGSRTVSPNMLRSGMTKNLSPSISRSPCGPATLMRPPYAMSGTASVLGWTMWQGRRRRWRGTGSRRPRRSSARRPSSGRGTPRSGSTSSAAAASGCRRRSPRFRICGVPTDSRGSGQRGIRLAERGVLDDVHQLRRRADRRSAPAPAPRCPTAGASRSRATSGCAT